MAVVNLNNLDSSSSALKAAQNAKLMDSCQQFEGQFLNMMLEEMRKTVPDDPLLGDDAHEQQIFQSMMDDNISEEMAKSGQGGDLAIEMYKQLSRTQNAASGASGATLPKSAIDVENEGKNLIPLLKLPGIGTDNEDHDND